MDLHQSNMNICKAAFEAKGLDHKTNVHLQVWSFWSCHPHEHAMSWEGNPVLVTLLPLWSLQQPIMIAQTSGSQSFISSTHYTSWGKPLTLGLVILTGELDAGYHQRCFKVGNAPTPVVVIYIHDISCDGVFCVSLLATMMTMVRQNGLAVLLLLIDCFFLRHRPPAYMLSMLLKCCNDRSAMLLPFWHLLFWRCALVIHPALHSCFYDHCANCASMISTLKPPCWVPHMKLIQQSDQSDANCQWNWCQLLMKLFHKYSHHV